MKVDCDKFKQIKNSSILKLNVNVHCHNRSQHGNMAAKATTLVQSSIVVNLFIWVQLYYQIYLKLLRTSLLGIWFSYYVIISTIATVFGPRLVSEKVSDNIRYSSSSHISRVLVLIRVI